MDPSVGVTTQAYNSVDVTTRAYNSVTSPDHIALLIALGIIAYFTAPILFLAVVNSERGKRVFGNMLHAFFDNGGGVKLRTMMKEENAEQSKVHAAMTAKQIEDAIREHEEQERLNLEELIAGLRTEITGEYPIVPAKPAPRPRLTATLHTRRRPRR